MELWGKEFTGESFVMLQGTQRTYTPARSEKALMQWQTSTHDVWELKVSKRAGAGAQPEGVAIMAPKGFGSIARNVYAPQAKDMEGRILAVHFRNHLFDILVVSMYCHVGDRSVERQRKTERMYDWCRHLRA